MNELMKEKTEKEAQLEEKMDRWMYLTDLVEQIESQNSKLRAVLAQCAQRD